MADIIVVAIVFWVVFAICDKIWRAFTHGRNRSVDRRDW